MQLDKDRQSPIHLFLNGLELKKAIGRLYGGKKDLVIFDLQRSADDSDSWAKIMAQPRWGDDAPAGTIPIRIGAGTDGVEFDIAEGARLDAHLEIFDPNALALGVAAFISAVVALVFAARASAILRDGNATSSYSLARVQMAFWLYLVTAGFLCIWLVTGDYNGVLTSQSLTLLGISATTGVMAIAVKDQTLPAASDGFWMDLLGDNESVAVHRLQIVVWTAILGVIFFKEIYESFRLPTFDSNLLILMGISGGTYVGFKINETKRSTT
jgi:hypothetical protein